MNDRELRFIPTPVGNTAVQECRRCRWSVHPHARGEHPLLDGGVLHQVGSSPRPWGTRADGTALGVHWRFIPTPVGTTLPLPFGVLTSIGSSPRPWGTHPLAGLSLTNVRFIPTPVGNTTTQYVSPSRESVHPHARGEHQS